MMEVLPSDTIFEFNPNTLDVVRKFYELDKPGAMDEAIDILENWIEKQDHFTKKKFSRNYLERMVIANKGSVERTKTGLDRNFTIRTMLPDFFKDYDARYDFKSMLGIATMVILPKMTKDYNRVCFVKPVGKKFSTKILQECHYFCLLLMEYARGHDYAKSYHVILDYLDVEFKELLAASDLIHFRQLIVALMDGYGLRVKSIHVLINSKVMDIILTIAKQVLNDKMKKRTHIHKTYDELYQHLPKEIFPKDIGGEENSLAEIQAKIMEAFSTEDFREYWREMNSARTNESLRKVDTFNEHYMGMPGTFRSCSVD